MENCKCKYKWNLTLVKDENFKWKQFLLAKGCNVLLKDNPYLNGQGDT
jgi:hypothetical protein